MSYPSYPQTPGSHCAPPPCGPIGPFTSPWPCPPPPQGTEKYIGARYVPKFAGEWNLESAYEALSVVTYQGSSYTSKKPVPANTSINDAEYWVQTGNLNGAIEQLQTDLATEITNRETADTDIRNTLQSEIESRQDADTALGARITAETTARQSADTTLTNNLNTEIANRTSADTSLGNRITAETTARQSADTTLTNNLNTEIANRTSADTALMQSINSIKRTIVIDTVAFNEFGQASGAQLSTSFAPGTQTANVINVTIPFISRYKEGTTSLGINIYASAFYQFDTTKEYILSVLATDNSEPTTITTTPKSSSVGYRLDFDLPVDIINLTKPVTINIIVRATSGTIANFIEGTMTLEDRKGPEELFM